MKITFARRVKLVSQVYGIVREVHREEAFRMYHEGQALHEEGTSRKDVKMLLLPDMQPGTGGKQPHSTNSLITAGIQTLHGGSQIAIESPATYRPREVTTSPCRLYKLNPIRDSHAGFYGANALRELVRE